MAMRPTSMSPRGDQTRESLIDAAVEVFGRDGFSAASTRSIADRAGVNQALIGYHFGGKPGLYLAVFDRITRRVAQYLGPVAQAIEEQLEEIRAGDERQAARCVGFIHQLTDALVATFSAPESSAWARLVLREQQNPSEAFDRLYGGMIGRMLSLISRLIAHRLRREAKVIERLRGAGGASLDTLVASVYDDVDPRLHPVAKSSLLAHLLKLEQEGRAARESSAADAVWMLKE